MRRLFLMAFPLCILGCGPKETPTPPIAPIEGDIDFTGWPAAMAEPYLISTSEIVYCVQPRAQKIHGPHVDRSIVVRTNPEAIDDFRARRPLAVGSTVVKEKWPNGVVGGRPPEYGAMIKREAGYDPANGDWEYLFFTGGDQPRIERGRLETCIDCHCGAAGSNHLFRTYLK